MDWSVSEIDLALRGKMGRGKTQGRGPRLWRGPSHLGCFKMRMDGIARAYLAAGVQPGDRVAMLAAACNEFLTTYMAAGKVGAVWLGLNPKFTLDELRYQIVDSRPVVLIVVRTFLGNDMAATIRAL